MKSKLTLILLLSVNELFSQTVPQKVNRPNIIFIMADDLGYGDLGCYGQKQFRTHQIDQMAKEGIRFTQHYTTGVCAPSRGALMTGKHLGHSKIRGNREVMPHGQIPLADDEITVAEKLKEAGYRTGLIGKWGLGIEGTTGEPTRQGFDSYYGYLCQVLAHNSFPEFLMRNGQRELLRNKVSYLPESDWSRGWGSVTTEKIDFANYLFAEESLQFVTKNKDNPFFLYLTFTAPHDNGEAPKNERIEVPDLGEYANKNWTNNEKAYASLMERLDSYIGELRQRLKEHNLEENTLLIFTSDNGAYTYTIDNFKSNGALRGIKREMYEGGLRTPFVAVWKGKIHENQVSDRPIALWDFMPTVCDILQIKLPNQIDGISYLPTLLGKKQSPRPYLYFELHDGGNKQALRKGNWKLIRLYNDTSFTTELYNIKKDEAEKYNVANQYPNIVQELEKLMEKEHEPDTKWTFKK